MADLDLWTDQCSLSQYADDTQSLCIAEDRDKAVEMTRKEANNVIDFFTANDLKNNAKKSCVVYNSRGQGKTLTLEDVGGVNLTSLKDGESEKLLGLHVSNEFNWKIHVDKIIAELNKRMGLLRRMKKRLTRGKLIQVAESIFNSVIRYGIAVYLKPVFEKEEIKAQSLSTEARKLQTIQNKMLRVIFGFNLEDKVNMEKLRTKIGMFSVNQLNCYHVLVEAFNVINHGSSNKIQEKWRPNNENSYSNRREHNVKVPRVDHVKCEGFALYGAKMWNLLPDDIKLIKKPKLFQNRVKEYLWANIPSY